MAASKDNTAFQLSLANREKRRNQQQTPGTPVREIRLLSTYEFPKKYKYLDTYRDIIVRILQQKQFLCPGYSHIYISIGETEEDAIAATYETYDWLFKLNVTNKLIHTKPRANMLLVLKGRKMELELNIEKIMDGSGLLTYVDTTAPVTQEIIDLEKKLGWRQPRDKA